MNAPKALTEDQAKLIRELGLAPESVRFKKQGAKLPCQIIALLEGRPTKYWVSRDATSGKLKLGDEKPSWSEPRREDESPEDEVVAGDPLDLEKVEGVSGKWQQPDKQAPFEGNAQPSYNPATLETDLQKRGFSELAAKAVVAQVCDGDTIREAAKRVGKSHGWVGRKRIQRVVEILRKGMPLPIATAATAPSDAARTAVADAGNRWTLPEAMVHARQEVDNYLPSYANDLGIGALGLGKLFSSENRRLTEEQMEQLRKMSPQDRLALLLPPGRSVAEAITASIRLNPRSLLNPNSSERLVAALVDLLEAAHFGNFEHRIPWLLPKDNHKLAAETARKALDVLVSGNQGNPREYPTHLLAGVVGIMQIALAPLQRTWRKMIEDNVPRAARLKAIRERFLAEAEELGRVCCPAQPQEPTRALMVEVENLTDSELQSRLANNADTSEHWKRNLLAASARLAERATGISFKSFLRAWEKEPSLRQIHEAQLRP